MPKVITPKSSPTKRAQASQAGSSSSSPAKPRSPRKKKVVEVQDRSSWRPSHIPESATIAKSIAIKNYHLNANDLQGLGYTTSRTVIKIGGVDRIKDMYLYKEREVEIKAWEKYGGPEGFENLLKTKMAKFYEKHGTSSGKFFPKPTTYDLPNDPTSSGCVYILQRPKHLPSRETCTPKLIEIKALMEARGQAWLWDLLNKIINDKESTNDMTYQPTLKTSEREALMVDAFKHMRYPPRPAAPLELEGASFKALTDLLAQAGSITGFEEWEVDDTKVDVHEDGFTGDRWFSWFKCYTDEVYACLDKVEEEHGVEGLRRARWLVYDKYVECGIGGPGYNNDDGSWGWYDDADFWLTRERQP